ncbi:bifunctional phosphoribosylaminoimidazolecarboxamide formyltransferase/IMP cyclohydrolase [Buchnera aphidicola]|uniref:bifunctional phosphoribosylaminoimidazolecarboxamide formyltransferase/IMP cyclohydrolase n=1 Tax=Buchnera aphidicola TaxID=9 RepID=UPI003464D22F
MKIKNALISVFDKSKILKLAKILTQNKIKILSTKGTRKLLKKNKIPCSKISDYTKCKEMFHGKIKTLHPKIYSGILSHPILDSRIIKKKKILSINLVIVNFYPFQKKKYTKYIDIGGPSLIRAAAKNYKNVIVITDIQDYKYIIEKILKKKKISKKSKLKLAMKAFKYSAKYEKKIYHTFKKKYDLINKKKIFPKKIKIILKKKKNLIYGENPHQKSALYIDNNFKKTDQIFKKIQGKKLSYNNIIDANIALECVTQFNKPSCVIIKHGTPCGASTKKNLLQAYNHAYLCDPESAFGGIIAFNKKLKSKIVQKIIQNQFVEIIIAPKISINSQKFLQKKKNIKILITNNKKINFYKQFDIKTINNQFLIQEKDYDNFKFNKENIVSQKKPTKLEIKDAIFGWKIAKFVKSNGIVYVYKKSTIAIGTGQTSRIFSIKNANIKMHENNIHKKNITMASDAFFPFTDNIQEAKKNNISCIIQPGGSIKDKEIINAVNHENISMIFTHIRHFKH